MHARPAGSARRQINKSPRITSLQFSFWYDPSEINFFDSLSQKSQRHFRADGNSQKSGDEKRHNDYAAGLGYELFGAGLRNLHDGH